MVYFQDCSSVIPDAPRIVAGDSWLVFSPPRLVISTPTLVFGAPSLIDGSPRHVIGTLRLVARTPQFSADCYQTFYTPTDFLRVLPGAPDCHCIGPLKSQI